MTSRDHAFDLAWDAVGRSEKSADELRRWLGARGVEPADIDAVLGRLVELGYVSDARVAEEAVQAAQGEKPVGKERVRAKLLRRGLDESLVESAVGEMEHASEVEKALTVAARLGSGTGMAKTARYLAARGFDEETVRDTLERLFPD
ncbi:MAG: regulatory protein RecX [Armatimonadetes bacterium]|nr:regulatory protein RecX [Armatimonadota bacterium]